MDLPNALSAQAVLVPDLFEGKRVISIEPEAFDQNITLRFAKVLHQIADLFGRIFSNQRIVNRGCLGVSNDIEELSLRIIWHWFIERECIAEYRRLKLEDSILFEATQLRELLQRGLFS